MAVRNISFEEILNEKPTLDELFEQVPISVNWYEMGIMLKVNTKRLDEIEKLSIEVPHKAAKMYKHWLDTNPQATRRQILETLRTAPIEKIALAQQYETKLQDQCPSILTGEFHLS